MLRSLKRFIKEGLEKLLLFEPHHAGKGERSKCEGVTGVGEGGMAVGNAARSNRETAENSLRPFENFPHPPPRFPLLARFFFFAYFLLRVSVPFAIGETIR